jgi:putative FmdB family regulatory protein
MPTYDYECKTCGHRFEAFQSINDQPLKACPECGKRVRRLIGGGTGIIFKGSGFYTTDYKHSSAVTSGNGSSKSQPKSEKSETNPPAEKSESTTKK